MTNKLIKGAVQRNRKKRQVRTVLEHLVPLINGEYDIIVLGQTACVDATYNDIQEDIETGLSKIGFLQ